MITLIIYCIFSYLFEIGINSIEEISWYIILLAPIAMPIQIGRGLAFLTENY